MTGPAAQDTADEGARAVLAHLLGLAPFVFPSVRVAQDWQAALTQAADMVKQGKETGR